MESNPKEPTMNFGNVYIAPPTMGVFTNRRVCKGLTFSYHTLGKRVPTLCFWDFPVCYNMHNKTIHVINTQQLHKQIKNKVKNFYLIIIDIVKQAAEDNANI